ncbi:MAG: TonB-dependent receptor [Bacteroidetes bacterium]|nr:TonB-dependent receptor [Bacteroidota bacterium]
MTQTNILNGKLKTGVIVFFVTFISMCASAQSFQTVRGTVTDQQSKVPIPSVSITISCNGYSSGTVSDIDGNYIITNVPIGRASVTISHASYQQQVIPDVVVEAGKETVLNAEMLEQVKAMSEVVIKAKRETINDKQMATVSASVFNAEDTRRYAGSRNDVARMASNFAGVISNNDSRNDIIIRGNAPTGLLWRVEGVDVPNPNHFGQSGATGGPVSMINNNVLDKSAFYTSAFPAQFGNANAGVFDLQLRDGNNNKREYMAQVGLSGLEFGAEGYFSKNSKASYLVDYRYSVPGLLQKVGVITGTGSAIPYYQDLSFKVSIPTQKAGKFTIFGVGGLSNISFKGDIADTQNFYNDPYSNLDFKSNSGVAGITNTYFISKSLSNKVTLAVSGQQIKTIQDSLDDSRNIFPNYREHTNEWKYTITDNINKKFSSKDRLQAGATAHDIHFSFADSTSYDNRMIPLRKEVGSTQLLQAYASWQHRFTDKIMLNSGIFSQYLTLNNSYAIEPRLGAKFQAGKSGSINLGAGMHSQMQDLMLYFLKTKSDHNTYTETNHSLDFTRSAQFVAGWEQTIFSEWHYKIEAYYQHIYNVPIEQYPSTFSALNLGSTYGSTRQDSLVNKGTGNNYGIELTLEKKFSKGYYVTGTVSLFNSLYTGSDNIERNTAYNNNYVVNALAGKEWKVGKSNTICIDGKLAAAGGKRYIPIDLQASISEGATKYNYDQAFEKKYGDYFRADIKLTYRMNRKKAMQEIYLDLQNVTNSKNILREGYDNKYQTIRTQYQLGFTPSVNYRIQF